MAQYPPQHQYPAPPPGAAAPPPPQQQQQPGGAPGGAAPQYQAPPPPLQGGAAGFPAPPPTGAAPAPPTTTQQQYAAAPPTQQQYAAAPPTQQQYAPPQQQPAPAAAAPPPPMQQQAPPAHQDPMAAAPQTAAPPLMHAAPPPTQQQQQQFAAAPAQQQQAAAPPPMQAAAPPPTQQQYAAPPPTQATAPPPMQAAAPPPGYPPQQPGGYPPQQPTAAAPPQQQQYAAPPPGQQQYAAPPPGQQQLTPTGQQAAYPQQGDTATTPQMAGVGQAPPAGGGNVPPPRTPPARAANAGGATPPPTAASNASMSGAPAPATGSKPPPKRARARKTPNKIDSSQVPTPARDLPFASPHSPRPTVGTLKGYAPLSITHFIAQDEGSASAKFMRPTVHAAPFDDAFVRDSNMPWSVVLSPLYDQFEVESERVPVVTGRNPIRCHRCRAYMNPQAQFTELGKKWVCPFCGHTHETEPEYFCNLDSTGRRRDVFEKAELHRGSVEYDVSHLPEYALKNEHGNPMPNRPMSHLFAIDVSMGAKGHMASLVDSIRANVRQMAEVTPGCRVSFVTYADTLHFYNFSQASMPMLTVPDIDAPFVPLPFTLLCWLNVQEDAEKIEEFLDRLLTLPDALEETGCAAGAALKVASMILSETGGKLIMTASSAPNCGLGALQKRDLHKLYTTENEKQLFKPVEGFWPSAAIECAKKQVTVDLIAFPTEFCELVTMGYVAHLTGGTQSMFPNFSRENDEHRLFSALKASLVEEAGYGAILRVRTSQGVRVNQYHGHFCSNDPQDMDLAGVSSSHTFVVDLKHEGKLDPKGFTHLQLALLYTTRSGQRRVRVHTAKMSVCNTHASLFRHADLEATLVTMMYHGVHEAMNKGTKVARDALTEKVLKILLSYRRFCASSSHTGQLLLPEQLKLLPLYILCGMKSDALVTGCSSAIDQRVQSMFDLMSMPITAVLEYLYPRLYALQTTLNHPSTGNEREDGVAGVYMPPLQQLTTDTVMCHGIYALLDRQVNLVYLWIGSNISPRVSAALFNGEDDASKVDLSTFDTWHERIKKTLSQIVAEGKARVILVHEGTGGVEDSFFRCMLEDEAVPAGQTYSEYLCYLHKAINTRMS